MLIYIRVDSFRCGPASGFDWVEYCLVNQIFQSKEETRELCYLAQHDVDRYHHLVVSGVISSLPVEGRRVIWA